MIASFVLKIKQRETPFFAKLYNVAKTIRQIGVPSIYVIHRPLYVASRFLINLRWLLQQSLWSVPLFKTRCRKCGSRLRLPNGIPWIEGPLQIEVGNNANLAKSTLMGGHVFDQPLLKIGNYSQIGYNSMISVNQLVEIGDRVKMAHNCFIADSDGHPTDINRRHGSLFPEEVKPVKIEDNVWIGACCIILKGVTIGNNAIVAADTVVTKNVPPNIIVAGPNGEIVKRLEG